MKYLGHAVARDGIRACSSKVNAIAEMPKPATTKGVQRFVGQSQYYRKFIPNFSQIAAPLFKAPCGLTRVISRGHGSRGPWFPTPFWCIPITHRICYWIATDMERVWVSYSCMPMTR